MKKGEKTQNLKAHKSKCESKRIISESVSRLDNKKVDYFFDKLNKLELNNINNINKANKALN